MAASASIKPSSHARSELLRGVDPSADINRELKEAMRHVAGSKPSSSTRHDSRGSSDGVLRQVENTAGHRCKLDPGLFESTPVSKPDCEMDDSAFNLNACF